ncbi:MAG: rod shape-determining protein MreC [Deltaproteobacteria bacterium]|nr:MAG: rod shape-determining protein MreC [Deltaproteobacteria bacterium]
MLKFLRRYYRFLLSLLFLVLSLQFSFSRRNLPFPFRQMVSAVSTVSFSLAGGVAGLIDSLKELGRDYLFLRGVVEENEKLRKELELLRLKVARLEELEKENERLKKLLAFAGDGSDLGETVTARVITQDLTPWSKGFFISAGQDEGIERGMAVLTPEGIVGKVYRVFEKASYVVSLLDHRFTLDVRTGKGRVRCLLKGTGSGVVVKYLRTTDDVEEGELLVTTGFEGRFPRGFPAATIASMEEIPGSIFRKVEALPLVDLRKVEEVFVLKGVRESTGRKK